MSTEAEVRLPEDSTGKAIRLAEVEVLDEATGAQTTVYQEVVAIADADGNFISVSGQGRPRLLVTAPRQYDLQVEILEALKTIQAILVEGLRPSGGNWANALHEGEKRGAH